MRQSTESSVLGGVQLQLMYSLRNLSYIHAAQTEPDELELTASVWWDADFTACRFSPVYPETTAYIKKHILSRTRALITDDQMYQV